MKLNCSMFELYEYFRSKWVCPNAILQRYSSLVLGKQEKLFCRLENLPETKYSILKDLKASLRLTCSVIRYSTIDIRGSFRN